MNNTIKCIGLDWKNEGKEEIYRFPDNWDIREYRIKNVQKLDDDAIGSVIAGEFVYKGVKTRLTELAAGKKNVFILVDDLSRFTPSYKIAPYILRQLRKAGVGKENIRFMTALGSHMKMTKDDMVLKLGEEIVKEYIVVNHDCMNDEMEYLGTNTYGTPVRINKKVADADLVIGIGSLNKHRFAYGSGGAKIILPGVSHIETIRHNHRAQMIAYSDAKSRFGILRDGMNEAGGMLSERTDFIVADVVLNRERDITNIFIGDCIDVFVNNTDNIFKNYTFGYDKKACGKNRRADIGIFRVDTLDPLQIGKAISNWSSACRLPVVTGDFAKHIYQGSAYGTYDEYMAKYNKHIFTQDVTLREAVKNKRQIIFSDNLDAKSAIMWNAGFYVTGNWEELMSVLTDVFGKKAKVAFFHDAYFQILDKKIVLGSVKNKSLRKLIDLSIKVIRRIARIKNRILGKRSHTPAPIRE
jgi:hypothetical protein